MDETEQDAVTRLLREREEIGRQLHERVGQLLASAVFNLESTLSGPLPASLRDEVVADLRQALVQVRSISVQLAMPPAGPRTDGAGDAADAGDA